MTEIQTIILDVYKEFKRICDENGLRYFAIGGTCIGAIRNKGFIPWDDDMDVAMPFEDYIRFQKIVQKNLNEPYELFCPGERKYHLVRFLKLHNKKTTFVEQNRVKYPETYMGVFMDIMPLVGFPENHKMGKCHIRKCRIYLAIHNACNLRLKDKPTLKSKIFSLVSKPFTIGKPFNHYLLKYQELISRYKFGETKDVFFAWRVPLEAPYKNIFPYEIFAESISVPFEDTEMRVPKDYDCYLKMDFGDYMKLPPEDKRMGGHPAAILDLHKSYKEYVKEYAECKK